MVPLILGLVSNPPDAVPPANQSDEVGNGDARKPRGLQGPV